MTPLVFLPGMMCDERLFAPQTAVLKAKRDVLTLPIHAHQTVRKLATDILDQAPEVFALAGLSMGGIVAMEVIRQAPSRVAGVALMDTNPKAEHPHIAQGRTRQIAKAKAGHLAAVMRDEMKPNYLAQTANRDVILDLCMDMALSLGPGVFENQSCALAGRPDQQGTLKAYEGPTLILCGEQDALCPVHRHTLMHALMPQSTLVVLPDAGHLPTLEQPGQTTTALTAWLKEIPNG